jgi:hypothetical protein
MGRKISVDSATMMNKALEVIEARHLFGVLPEQIEVVIHPQSVVHSMVQFTDASVIAQLGTPDMRVPIAVGLAWPERIESGAGRLDFRQMAALSFDAPDAALFPGLGLAWHALRAAPGTTAVRPTKSRSRPFLIGACDSTAFMRSTWKLWRPLPPQSPHRWPTCWRSMPVRVRPPTPRRCASRPDPSCR